MSVYQAIIQKFASFNNGLTRNEKVGIYGTLGSLVGVFALNLFRKYMKTVKQVVPINQVPPNELRLIEGTPKPLNKYFVPLSTDKWFFGSYILTGMTWLLCIKPILFDKIPKLFSHKYINLNDLILPLPKKLSHAFQLGQYQEQISQLTSQSNSVQQINNILKKCTALLDRKELISVKQLNTYLSTIIAAENEQSLTQKVVGVFRFVNVVWFFSILGISVTIIPVVYYFFEPLWLRLYELYKKVIDFLSSETMVKIYEKLLYIVPWYFMYMGISSNKSIGKWLSLTGFALYYPALYVSGMIRHSFDNKDPPRGDAIFAMVSMFTGLIGLPLAVRHNSKLFGYISIGGLYAYLVSAVSPLVFGFDNDRTIGNTVFAGMVFNAYMIFLKLKNVDINKYSMLQSPALIASNISIYFGLLIHAFRFRLYRSLTSKEERNKYWKAQSKMISALLYGFFVGYTLKFQSMTNTAIVFSGIYTLNKILEFEFWWKSESIWYTGFTISIIGWRTALYLNRNPQIIVNMFKW